MHVGTSTGVISSRKVTMAGLPHGSYGVLVLDTVGISVSSGVIGHGLSIYCTCLHEWLRRMSHGCVNIWVAHLYAFALYSSYARSQDHENNKFRQACTVHYLIMNSVGSQVLLFIMRLR
jgi:hypothetical protein